MDVQAVLAAQTEMYGEPLGQRIGRLLAAYQIEAALGRRPWAEPADAEPTRERAKDLNGPRWARLVWLEELARHARHRGRAGRGAGRSRPALSTSRMGSGPSLATGSRGPGR